MGERICSIEGCNKKAEKRGWCAVHYRRWRLYGDPLTFQRVYERRSPGDPNCGVEGCERKHYAKGWCHGHWQRIKLTGEPGSLEFRHHVDTPCAIEGCDKLAKARGWCDKHYQRWLKYGDPNQALYIFGDDWARFWSYVDTTGICWEWLGGVNGRWGYGQGQFGGRSRRAHRMAWELLVGPISEGLEVDHLCRNRRCVNPDHLEPVTRSENRRRAIASKTW